MANSTGMNAMSRKGKWTVRVLRGCRSAWVKGVCVELFPVGRGDEIHVRLMMHGRLTGGGGGGNGSGQGYLALCCEERC